MTEISKLADGQLDFDREMVEHAYDRWAPVYDLVFGGVFGKGRRAAIAATNSIGGRVLEVGIGTGISLPQYAPQLRCLRHRYFGGDASQGEVAGDRTAPEECRRSGGDGCGETRISGLLVRRRDGAICRHRRAQPGSRTGRVRPGVAARRRTDPAQPRQRGHRNAPLHRAGAEAGGAPAGLSAPNSPGRATRNGWPAPMAWSWSNADRCRRSAISR